MADSTLSKVIQLIGADGPIDLREAATKVAGRVGTVKDKGLIKTLLAVVQAADTSLRLAAVEALGLLKAEEALPVLAALVREGGPEAAAAAHAASQLGAKGARALDAIMREAAPRLRSRLAAVMAKSGAGNALVVTAHALVDDDPNVVDAAARSLAMEVPSFTSGQRHALAKFLMEKLQEKKPSHSAKAEAALVRVLGTLHEAKAEDMFWARVSPPAAFEVRAAAVQALGNQSVPVGEAHVQKLMACAAEGDFQVVASALMMLKSVPVTAKNQKQWLKLLAAPDVATRRFAVEKLQGCASKEVARGLIEQIHHADRQLRDEALHVLQSNLAGRQSLIDETLAAETVDDAWFMARALTPVAKELSPAQRARLFEQAAHYHDRDDRRAAAIWHLLKESAMEWARDQLEARALELRKQKKYAAALGYFRLLTQDPACSEDLRFEFAATGLKESAHDLSAEQRQNDPPLIQFARLLQDAGFDLKGKLAKSKWLEPEELFYLGFHFAEQTHRARAFGKQVLEMVAQRSPKSEIAKQAKRKLKSEGLG